MTPKEALEKAIQVAGSQTALAAGIGGKVKTGHIFYWLESGRVPAEHCPGIERVTREKGETVFCEDLCPTTDWGVLRSQSYEAQQPYAGPDRRDPANAPAVIPPRRRSSDPAELVELQNAPVGFGATLPGALDPLVGETGN